MSATRLRIVRAADGRRMRWKNGGGETVEIATGPGSAGLDDFTWRLSTARILASGPFSIFPGIDRSLAVLDGQGLDLRVGDAAMRLTAGGDAMSFPGEAESAAALVAGPVTALNIMTRRGCAAHRLQRLKVDGAAVLETVAGTVLVFCADGHASLGTGEVLTAGDAACVDEPQARMTVAGDAAIYLIALDPG